MRILAGAKAIVTSLCRHSRVRRYRSKNRCGLSRRPLIKDPTSARMNPAPFEKTATGGIDTIIKDRSARWPVPGTKRETLSPSLYSLRLSFLSNIFVLFLRPTSVFSFRMSGRKRSCVYILKHMHSWALYKIVISLLSWFSWITVFYSHHIICFL